MFTGVGEIPHPPCQSHCELQSLKTMKSIRLDVSSDTPAFHFSSFSFPFPPPPSTSALHRILSASCWATSLWEADTMADIMLSTPNEPCFPRDFPRSSGNKTPRCSSGQLGPARVEHFGFRALHRCSLPSLFSAQMLLPGVASLHPCTSYNSTVHLVFRFSTALQLQSPSAVICLHVFAYSLPLCISKAPCACFHVVPAAWYITCNQDISAKQVDK